MKKNLKTIVTFVVLILAVLLVIKVWSKPAKIDYTPVPSQGPAPKAPCQFPIAPEDYAKCFPNDTLKD